MMKNLTRRVVIFLASGSYTGYSPYAPGTVGTLAGIALFIPFLTFDPLSYFLLLLVFTAFACWIADEAEKIFQAKDCRKIVIDEMAGYLFTMLWIPIAAGDFDEIMHDFLPKALAGFFLFRLTDILKPFPARWIDRNIKNGVGVVLDDVVAGIYANLLLRLLIFIAGRIF